MSEPPYFRVPECPKCGGPMLSGSTGDYPRIRCLCCGHRRKVSHDAWCDAEDISDSERREIEAYAERWKEKAKEDRAKYERAMRGEW